MEIYILLYYFIFCVKVESQEVNDKISIRIKKKLKCGLGLFNMPLKHQVFL